MAELWRRLVGLGFRLLYNELAFTYDWVSIVVSLGAWRCWQRAALPHLGAPPGARVLELAHGTGSLQLDLHTLGYIPIGYDLSPYMGRIAQNKLSRRGLPPRLVRGRAQQLPFPAASFAAIVCTFPTDFIFQPETLRETHRVLSEEGRLIIVPNGVLTGTGAAARFIEWLYRITGQREASGVNIAALFDTYGFEAHITRQNCPRSTAQVIIARKKV